MKTITRLLVVSLLAVFTTSHAADLTSGMKQGKAEFKSMGPLAFGPDGILFVADTKAAAVVAIATTDTASKLRVERRSRSKASTRNWLRCSAPLPIKS